MPFVESSRVRASRNHAHPLTMPILICCPNSECGRVLSCPDSLAGQKVICPKCQTERLVPMKEAWYVNSNHRDQGPFNRSEIQRQIQDGTIQPNTWISSDGSVYAPAGRFFEFPNLSEKEGRAPSRRIQESAEGPSVDSTKEKPRETSPMNSDGEAEGKGETTTRLEMPGETFRPPPPRAAEATPGQGPLKPPPLPTASQSSVFRALVERYQPGSHSPGDPNTVTCPHCWTVFPIEDVLFKAAHPDLLGDPLLGNDEPQRFKPSRFTPDGLAIDPGGMPSDGRACPNCHLEVPRSLFELKPYFFSIIGAPASGKSFYLAASTWELRRTLSQEFGFTLTDAETGMNRLLQEYEETLFLPGDPNAYVTLRKTELQGELYSQVNFYGQVTRFPKPFIFSLNPLPHNPAAKRGGRSIVLYDNAGEHFEPGADTSLSPTTHLARAKFLFFIFDPTKDPRFRARLPGNADPQVRAGARTHRQDVVLNEAASRVRRYLGLRHDERTSQRLIVIVSKLDVWSSLLDETLDTPPYVRDPKRPAVTGLDIHRIERVSGRLRQVLQESCPELIVAAEGLCKEVTYIAVSALGHSPTLGPQGMLSVRPADVRPVWVTVPFLYAFAVRGLILTPSSERSTEKTRLLRRSGGLLTCSLPDGTVLQIPENLAGKRVRDPGTGRIFVVPPIQKESSHGQE